MDILKIRKILLLSLVASVIIMVIMHHFVLKNAFNFNEEVYNRWPADFTKAPRNTSILTPIITGVVVLIPSIFAFVFLFGNDDVKRDRKWPWILSIIFFGFLSLSFIISLSKVGDIKTENHHDEILAIWNKSYKNKAILFTTFTLIFSVIPLVISAIQLWLSQKQKQKTDLIHSNEMEEFEKNLKRNK